MIICTIKHRKGRDNIIADFFSRNPSEKFKADEKNNLIIHDLVEVLPITVPQLSNKNTPVDKKLRDQIKSIGELQDQDDRLAEIKENIKRSISHDHYSIYVGVLFRKDHSLQ